MRFAAMLLLLVATLLAPSATSQAQAAEAVAQAKSLRKAGKAAEAAALLATARAAAPRDEQLAGLHGLCLLDAGREAEARAVGDAFAGYDGKEPRLLTLLGRLAQGRGEWDAALQRFEAALAVDGRLLEPAVEVVRTDIAAGRFAAAVTAAARVEAQQPDLGRRLAADALIAQADRFAAQGVETLGLSADKLAAAFELRPDDHALGERLLDLQVRLLRVREARVLIPRLFPQDRAQAQYWEGRCRGAEADPAGARQSFEAAIAADAAHAGALLELASLEVEAGNFEAARARLARVPKDSGARRELLLGLAEDGLGHDAAAEAALRKALELEPGSSKAGYHLGRLLVRTGRGAEGRALLAKVAAAEVR
jgi:hypothetical protein